MREINEMKNNQKRATQFIEDSTSPKYQKLITIDDTESNKTAKFKVA